ncbi:hypothetical protein [Hyphococcus luteus]|uniref:Uncharacterized protein n=1 Tax=Hyphococcus luteus TaxID=2058213 RepID=A0A2S7K9B5_9PROT|nr:hypothetical protein [Marinicaulis flavus]PQA89095.1 hypothetical protein CW354_03870 [Marinicaulis flavus]
MIIAEKDRIALEKLLRLAREEGAVLSEDLADIAAARTAAEISLRRLDEAGPGGEHGPARRRRLAVTLATLDRAEAEIREKLETASALAIRFEALMARDAQPRKGVQKQTSGQGAARAV